MNFKRLFFVLAAGVQVGLLVMMILFMQEIKQQKDVVSEGIFEDFLMQQDSDIDEKQEHKAAMQITLPFSHYVVATGQANPSTNYVRVHAKHDGVIQEIYAVEGKYVKKGSPLFQTDNSALYGKLRKKQAKSQIAKARLARLEAKITPSDIKKKERDLEELYVKSKEQEKECKIFQSLFQQDAVTASEKAEQEGILRSILTNLEKQSIEYESMKAGPTREEKAVYLAEIAEQEGECQKIQQEIIESKVRAPISGKVLEVQANPGQFISSKNNPVIILGDDENMHLHVKLDEKQAWRIVPQKKLKAVAVHKSNPNIHFVLEFLRVRPCLAKTEEKLELIFAFKKGDNPIYLGEFFDVYVEASASSDTSCLDYKFNNLSSN